MPVVTRSMEERRSYLTIGLVVAAIVAAIVAVLVLRR